MSRPVFNILDPKPTDIVRRLPWPAVAATLFFILTLGNDMADNRQKLAALRYDQTLADSDNQSKSSMPSPPEMEAISTELTYPWDHVLNQLYIDHDQIEFLSYEAVNDDSPNHLRVKALQLSTFWPWLDRLKTDRRIHSVSAVSVASQEGNHVFDVAIHWRQP